MNIHKNLDSIKSVALLSAVEHKCNYNIIISHAVNGEFDPDVSTYEFVRDSYFEKERPNDIILHRTDDLLNDEANIPEYIKSTLKANVKTMAELIRDERVNPFEQIPFVITNPYQKLKENFIPGNVEQVINSSPKVGRNDPCPCGSGKKFKHCCINKK